MVIGFARQNAMMRQLDVRQDRLETTIAALTETTHGTATRVEETAARVHATQTHLAHLSQRVAELENASGHHTHHHPGGHAPRPSFLPPDTGS
ncbi:hypothetical protein O7632_31790 [Solwaraspora sp. WMMD406]|uniref:hypothetical protein n=1 Tax=Solwaraspora sp. WMMD406 TaxID=3016095 RepID=UPI002417BBA6|nr:hypothetical protein [Solwaraspora sp. WMMD406]MDG4768636.1 hypothetical protein [Solwaraspora sp. WMMD406]